MERPHYRRQSRTGRYGGKQPEKRVSVSEIIIKQCIVSGIIFSFILLLNLINTDFTQDIREELKIALSNNMSADEIKKAAGKSLDTFSDMQNSVKTIMGGTPETTETYVPTPEVIPDNSPRSTDDTSDPSIQASPSPDFRIDEDILLEMNKLE